VEDLQVPVNVNQVVHQETEKVLVAQPDQEINAKPVARPDQDAKANPVALPELKQKRAVREKEEEEDHPEVRINKLINACKGVFFYHLEIQLFNKLFDRNYI
jgi:hypothetical protein